MSPIDSRPPLRAGGQGALESKLVEVLDKGSGAIVTCHTVLRCPEIGTERPPDLCSSYVTRPEQALLYRLSGDRHRPHGETADQISFRTPDEAHESVIEAGSARTTS